MSFMDIAGAENKNAHNSTSNISYESTSNLQDFCTIHTSNNKETA